MNPENKNDWHRFTLEVLRVEAAARHCSDCQREVPLGAGPVVAVGYHYYASVIADTLVMLARGATYADASQSARKELNRAGVARSTRLGLLSWPGDEPSANGQLAADWLEAFAPVVLDDPEPWPEVLLLDSTEFWRRKDRRKIGAFSVLMAYGYNLRVGPHPAPEDPLAAPEANYHRGRVLAARAFPGPTQASWEAFLASRPGNPMVVVADGARSIRKAVAARWPRSRGFLPPEFVRCQWHLAFNLRKLAGRDIARVNATKTGRGAVSSDLLHPDEHPLITTAAEALRTPEAWRAYRELAYTVLGLHKAFTDDKPSSVLKWVAENEHLVLSQQARRNLRPGPASIGPLEGHIQTLRPWLARRAQAIRNPDRTNLLLDLMVEGINNTASRTEWADRIYDHLAAHDGQPALRQRRLRGKTF